MSRPEPPFSNLERGILFNRRYTNSNVNKVLRHINRIRNERLENQMVNAMRKFTGGTANERLAARIRYKNLQNRMYPNSL